jgi:Flp pilus assembly protein TadD
MRYAEAGSLAARLGPERKPPSTAAEVDDAALLVEKIARGLHAAHEAGVVHRDIKPANLLLTRENEPLVADFGMARDLRTDSATLTERHHVVGTVPYMAPEQLAGERRLDRQTDVWALGVTLYELLAGRRPFEGVTLAAMSAAIEKDSPPRLRRLNPAVRAEYEAVAEVALEKERGRRYRTALDFADDLSRARRGDAVRARPPGPLLRWWRFAARRPVTAAFAFAALILLATAGGLGGFLWARRDDLAAQDRARADERLEALTEEAMAELAHGDKAAARRLVDAAAALRPQDPHVVLSRAFVAAFGERNWAAALDVLRAAPPSDDADAAEAYRRVEAAGLRALGRTAEADALVAGLAPPHAPLSLFVEGALKLDEAHRFPVEVTNELARAAARMLRNAVQFAPRPRRLHRFELAHAYLHTGEAAERGDYATALLALWPQDPVAQAWAAALFVRVDPKRALELAEAVKATGRLKAFVRRTSVAALRQLGERDQAAAAAQDVEEETDEWDLAALESHLRPALQADPSLDTPAMAATSLALAERRLKATPDHPDARASYGYALLRNGRDEEALVVLHSLLADHPEFGDGWRFLAEAHLKADRPLEAEAAARRATEYSPLMADTHRLLAKALQRQGRGVEAVAPLDRRASLAPTQSGAWFDLGLARMRLARFAEAESTFAEAARLDPEDPQVLCNWGQALRRTGRPSRAVEPIRKGHRIGSARANWRYDSAGWLARAEFEAKIEARLDLAARSDPLRDAESFAFLASAEMLDVATRICRDGGRRETESRAWIVVEEEFPDRLAAEHALRAPRAAAAHLLQADALDDEAITGGRTTPRPEVAGVRTRTAELRERARALLRAALAEREALFREAAQGGAAATAAGFYRTEMLGWWTDDAFRSVREPDARRVGAEAAAAWSSTWRECARVLSLAP